MEVNEPAVAYEKRKYTIEEYLERENADTEKHEYYKGEIFAMSGAKESHNDIAGNLFANLWNKLKGKPCKPHNSDTRVHIEKNSLFTYPDVSVVCGDRLSLNNDSFNLLNPSLIFEVLSPNTKQYDLNEKFGLYKDIPTLKEYITVDSEKIAIQAWHINNEGNWVMTAHNNINETLYLPTIQVSLEVKDIYEDVKIG